jgi:hypothetical protein
MSVFLAVACDLCEQPAWEEAAALLGDCLGRDGAVSLRFAATPEDLAGSGADAAIASLLPPLWRLDEPWTETEARWHRISEGLQAGGAPTAFLCTVFRHLAADATPAEAALRTRIRARRLNLLAAQLSQETGILVIDLDRALAHVGGRALGADARLQSAPARRLAAIAFAGTLLTVGLDHVLTDERREAALAALGAHRAAAEAPVFGAPTEVQVLERAGPIQRFVGRREVLDDRGALGLLRDLRQRRITLAQAAPQLLEKVTRRSRGFFDRLRRR